MSNRYVCEFAYLESWLAVDYMAITVYPARRDGQRDRRYHGDTFTLPIGIVLDEPTLPGACRALMDRGDVCQVGDVELLQGEVIMERFYNTLVNAPLAQCVGECYQVARDYVQDNIADREIHVEMRRAASQLAQKEIAR